MKKSKNKIISILLIGILLCSLTITKVSANPDEGFDKIKAGDKYEYKDTTSSSMVYKDYKNGEETRVRLFSELTSMVEIEKVDKDKSYITVKESNYYYSYRHNYTEIYTISNYFDYDDVDGDDIPEDVDISLGGHCIIVGSWDDYTEVLDKFEEELKNASDDLDDFDYSFDINDELQTIELKVDYKTEEYKDSVIYTYHVEKIIRYIDFVLDETISKVEQKVDSIENKTYLEDNNIIICQSQLSESHTKRQGFWEIFGLWIVIGIGVAIAVVSIVIWKKRSYVY